MTLLGPSQERSFQTGSPQAEGKEAGSGGLHWRGSEAKLPSLGARNGLCQASRPSLGRCRIFAALLEGNSEFLPNHMYSFLSISPQTWQVTAPVL